MKYLNTQEAVFLSRPNRFIAKVIVNGKEETVHVKNTGRCKELLVPNCKVILEKSKNPTRKTAYDLIAVYKDKFGLINMDSQAPNAVVYEWLKRSGAKYIKPEYTFGSSRLDFYLEKDNRKILMEVKGCTLEINGVGYFPDAPTERGRKHLYELANAVDKGYECYIAFVIQMENVNTVLPNVTTDPEFGKALEYAESKGVKILYLTCNVREDELIITNTPLK